MTRPVNQIALELALVKVLKTRIGQVETTIKGELNQHLHRGTVYAQLADGVDVATVVVTAESEAPLVVEDERALLEWVKANRPTAVVESVRSSDLADILAKAKKTGEMPPGIGFGKGKAGSVSVGAQSKAQEDALLDAYRAGSLAVDLGHVLSISAPEGATP